MAMTQTGSEAPVTDGGFFLLEPTSRSPELPDLIRKARSAQNGSELLLTLLEETGLRPSETEITDARGMVQTGLTEKRNAITQDVRQADNVYRSSFFKDTRRKVVDIDAIERLHQATEEYDDSSVLGLLQSIRMNLPAESEAARATTTEADRIARLMIAQHVGDVAIGDIITEPVDDNGEHPVS